MRSVRTRVSSRLLVASGAMVGVALLGCGPEVTVDDPGGAAQAAVSEPAAGASSEGRVTVISGALGADGLRSYWLFARGTGRVVRARSPEAARTKWLEQEEEEKAGRAAPAPPGAAPDSKHLAIPIGPGGRTEA